jgi:hypothetical protein
MGAGQKDGRWFPPESYPPSIFTPGKPEDEADNVLDPRFPGTYPGRRGIWHHRFEANEVISDINTVDKFWDSKPIFHS